MKYYVWLPLTIVALAGCGTSTSPSNSTASNVSPATSNTSTSTGASTLGASKSTTLKMPTEPKDVVLAFLDSMRVGNAEQLGSLLSTYARAEIERQGLEISPIGSPQAKFEIGNEEKVNELTTFVESNWIEPAEAGKEPTSYEVVWELRKEAAGWRICSMAVDTHVPGEEVQIVNFEQLNEEVDQGTQPRVASLPNAGPGPGTMGPGAMGPGTQSTLPPSNFNNNQPQGQPQYNPSGLPQLPSNPLPQTNTLPQNNSLPSNNGSSNFNSLPPSNYVPPSNGLPQSSGLPPSNNFPSSNGLPSNNLPPSSGLPPSGGTLPRN